MSGVATPAKRAVSLASIQAPVKARLDRVHPELLKIVVHGLPAIEAVSGHLLKRLGKMFRPTLSLLASDIEGKGDDRAITCAAAIELMHLATLVHDDSVDHSVKRRGQPTVNALFSHEVSVIMGDFLYSRALQAMVSLESLEIMRLLTEVSNELAVGEMRQLGAIDKLSFDEEGYVALIRSKTGSLLRASCETGTFFGASRYRADMARYGERLGLAFQIADDLIDYVGDEAVTGKPTGADLKEHKVTLPLIAGLRKMSPAARKRVEALFADPDPSDEHVAEVVSIVAEAGGLEYARQRGNQFADEANAALEGLPESPVRAALADAIVYVMDRRS
ncbi:MAG TPA: polyprenyl synthetase family protein [Gemmatimonadaceae bacterium]|jgi:octaprenyl-diphosphate synthase|nr:polyprenyl synthetase family protein [Gemmatimonadaceae bacterium]